jgi:hypothetical protein
MYMKQFRAVQFVKNELSKPLLEGDGIQLNLHL